MSEGRRAAWRAQWMICTTPPVCLWGVATEPSYAAVQSVHHSQEIYEALTTLAAAPISRALRAAVREAIGPVETLRSLRPSWMEHRDRCQGLSSPPGTVPPTDRETYRQMSAEFPQEHTVTTWSLVDQAEQATIEAMLSLDRLQRVLSAYTGQSLTPGHRGSAR